MILIVGYGNSLRCDDGAGPALARMVAGACGRKDLRLLTVQQLGPEMAEILAAPEVTAVIFMDASVAASRNSVDGMVEKIELCSGAGKMRSPISGHYFPPAELLAYSKFLYGAVVPAWLVTIPGFDFGFGEYLSEETEKLLPALTEKVKKVIHDLS